MDTTLKDTLVSLHGSFHRDILSFISQIKSDVAAIGDRIRHVKNEIGEFATAHNELVDAHNDVEEKIKNLKLKLADLEDMFRRNNVKFRGIPETVPPADLRPYITGHCLPTT